MDSRFHEGEYKQKCEARVALVKKYIPVEYFKDKTLLEIGCGFADNGNMFSELGCHVTSTDSRVDNLQVAQQKYPHIRFGVFDADNNQMAEKFDIILHFGTLYHITNLVVHIRNLASACKLLILESEVSDSDDPLFFVTVPENGYDQATSGRGIRPSPEFVNVLLKDAGFEFRMIKDPIANHANNVFDWDVENTGTWRHGLRRFWICWKDIECPLKDE